MYILSSWTIIFFVKKKKKRKEKKEKKETQKTETSSQHSAGVNVTVGMFFG